MQRNQRNLISKNNKLTSRPLSLSWVLWLTFSILLSIGMGLGLVWISIEHTDLAYTIKQLQNELNSRIAFKNKLEVERERLLAPFELKQRAEKVGMHEADSKQIRRLLFPQPTIQ